MKRPSVFAAVCLLAPLLLSVAVAERPRALPNGALPRDARLGGLRDLGGYFPFHPPASKQAWEVRAEEVRRRVLVSQGLWPLPTRTALNPVVHTQVERDGYTMERVFFQAIPGFYVTGTLYRPTSGEGRRPGVLCPHGHWPQGRFSDRGIASARKEVESGAESFISAARCHLQARCVHLARIGCVVFHYDMIGYADSKQINDELAHKFGKQRKPWKDEQRWGLFSPQAESRFLSIMGLQTWSSIRALDFISSLPDVDPQRLAVTGASGGGTQTFMLAAVDSRVAAAVPAVMVSTGMQGGCTCENACGLRIGVGNVELAALFAPKPMGLTAADDWTREMETKGFPQLQQLYKLLGVEPNVALWPNTQFGHNYNAISRKAMYDWFNRHLGLGHREHMKERDFPICSAKELTVWDDAHPRPPGGPALEQRVVKWLANDAQRQLSELAPPRSDLRRWRHVVGPAIDTIIGRELPAAADVAYDQTGKQERNTYVELVGLLHDQPRKEVSPVTFLYPKQWEGHVVIWLSNQGKDGLLKADGSPIAPVADLLRSGVAAVGIDLLGQGEFLQGKQPPLRTRRVENPREAAAYTFGYNHTLFAKRVHDVLKLIAFVRAHEYQPKLVSLVGWNGSAGAWAGAARAQARDDVDCAVVHTRGFRFAAVDDIHSPLFLPGGAKYHDLPGMLAVAAPARLWLADPTPLVRDAYQISDGSLAGAGKERGSLKDAVQWLIAQ